MHSLKKQVFYVMCLFSLLVVVAILPVWMLNNGRSHLINRVNVTAMEQEPVFEYQPLPAYNTLERLQLTQKTSEETSSVIIDWKDDTVTENQQQTLLHSVKTQLAILQDMSIIPEFELPDQCPVKVDKRVYMDMQKPNDPINIWNVYFSCPSVSVNVYMDLDASKIYEVSIFSETQSLKYATKTPLGDDFMKYLAQECPSVQVGDEQFYTIANYSDYSAHIYVSSYNIETQKSTSYHFYDNSNTGVITKIEKEPSFTIITQPQTDYRYSTDEK